MASPHELDLILRKLGLPVPAPGTADTVQASIKALILALRDQPGFTTRDPIHIAPSFYAEPIAFAFTVDVAAGSSFASGVTWDPVVDGTWGETNAPLDTSVTAQEWPGGWIGYVQHAQAFAGQVASTDVLNPIRQSRWSLLKNNTPVRGFLRQIPTCDVDQRTNTDTTPQLVAKAQAAVQLGSFIRLTDGDSMSFAFENIAGAGTLTMTIVLTGYRIPTGIHDGRTPSGSLFD